MRAVQAAIKQYGTTDASGKTSCAYGVLFEKTANIRKSSPLPLRLPTSSHGTSMRLRTTNFLFMALPANKLGLCFSA